MKSRLVSAFQDKYVDHNSTPTFVEAMKPFGEINFGNFVTMIIETSCQNINECNINIHWKPFISRCGYCDIPYKVIARAENFDEDTKFIGKLANIDFKPLGRYICTGWAKKVGFRTILMIIFFCSKTRKQWRQHEGISEEIFFSTQPRHSEEALQYLPSGL